MGESIDWNSVELWSMVVVGAACAYWRIPPDRLQVYIFQPLIDLVPMKRGKWKKAVEFVSFVGVGMLVTHAVVDPATNMQALSAGLGWTALLSREVA
ncbi:MAG: hypothetical protein ACOC92_01800 [bacterium]